MTLELTFIVLGWSMAISSGLMAGTYFTFSFVVMPSLSLLEDHKGAEAMNSINRKIVQTSFMPLFFGSTLIALLMIVVGIWHWGTTGAERALFGGLAYLLGMFVVTAVRNVPLNNELDQAELDPERLPFIWRKYLKDWTFWNSIRAIACVVSMILTIDLIAL